MARLTSFFDKRYEVVGIITMAFVMVSIASDWPISWPQATAMAIAMMTYLGDRIVKVGPTGAKFDDGGGE